MIDYMKAVFDTGAGYIGFILLAVWGGTVNYIGRLKEDKSIKFSFVELVGEWAISGFAGLMTAYICIDLQLSWNMTAVLTGIAGHLGGRTIFIIETYIKHRLTK